MMNWFVKYGTVSIFFFLFISWGPCTFLVQRMLIKTIQGRVGTFCLEAEQNLLYSHENMTLLSHYMYLIINFTFSVMKRISITVLVPCCQFYHFYNLW